jgi:hypothetical protein
VLAIKPRPENADSMVDMTPEHSGPAPAQPTRRSEPARPLDALAERLSRGASIPLVRDFSPTRAVEHHDVPGGSISPELALVDPELSALARRELPDAPWLSLGGHGSSAPAATPALAPPVVVVRDEPISAPRPVENDAGVTQPSVRSLQLVPPPELVGAAPLVVPPPAPAVVHHEHVPPPRVSARAATRSRRRRRYVPKIVIAALVASAAVVGMVWYQSPDAPTLTGPATTPPAESVARTGGSTSATPPSAKTSGAKGAQGAQSTTTTKPKPRSLPPIRQRIAASGFTIATGGQLLVDARGREIVQFELSTPCGTIRVVGAPIDRAGGFQAKAEPLSGVTGDVRGRFVSARAATGRVALSGARCSARTLQFRASRS